MAVTLHESYADIGNVLAAKRRADDEAARSPGRTHELAWARLRVLPRAGGHFEVVVLTDDGAQAVDGLLAIGDDFDEARAWGAELAQELELGAP